MLELMNGGKCIGGIETVEFFEGLPDCIDDEVKTEEFFDEYECALNRLRHEVKKSVPVPVKVLKAISKGHVDFYSCGACGFSLKRSDLPIIKYCSNCGNAVDFSHKVLNK